MHFFFNLPTLDWFAAARRKEAADAGAAEDDLTRRFDAALGTALSAPTKGKVPTDSSAPLPSRPHRAIAREATMDIVQAGDAGLEWGRLQSMLSAFGLCERLVQHVAIVWYGAMQLYSVHPY